MKRYKFAKLCNLHIIWHCLKHHLHYWPQRGVSAAYKWNLLRKQRSAGRKVPCRTSRTARTQVWLLVPHPLHGWKESMSAQLKNTKNELFRAINEANKRSWSLQSRSCVVEIGFSDVWLNKENKKFHFDNVFTKWILICKLLNLHDVNNNLSMVS